MARGRLYRFARFARGLNTADGPYGLREGYEDDPTGLGAECRAAMNVVSKSRGNVKRRNGCASLFTTTSPLKDISVIGQDSTGFLVASDTAGRLLAIDESLVVTQLVTGLSTSARWTFLNLPTSGTHGPAYGMNGTDTPRETDGTLAGTGTWTATTGSVPNGKAMVYANNRLWVITDSALYWCEPGDPRNWPAANVTRFDRDDGSPLTGIAVCGPYVLVFKERAIWRVYDLDTSANVKIVDNAGTLSPRSIVSTEMGCFFLDPERGVMVTDGAQVQRVAENIQPYFETIQNADLPAAAAAFSAGHYYLAAKIDGTQVVLDYDTELKSWWLHSPALSALGVWDRGSGPILVGSLKDTAATWELFKDGELHDGGSIFESYWSGPYHVFGAPALQKRCRKIHADGRGTVSVFVSTDYDLSQGTLERVSSFTGDSDLFGGTGTFGGAGEYAGGVQIGEDHIFHGGLARAFSVSFYSAAAEDWEIDSYTMFMDQRKD